MIYEASGTGLLKTIFYIIVIYYALKFIGRVVLPIVLGLIVKKAADKMQSQYQQQFQQDHRSEGEVIVENVKSKKGTKKADDSEYVDYEEIK